MPVPSPATNPKIEVTTDLPRSVGQEHLKGGAVSAHSQNELRCALETQLVRVHPATMGQNTVLWRS